MMRSLYQAFTKETAAVHTPVKTRNYPFYFPFAAQSSTVMLETSCGDCKGDKPRKFHGLLPQKGL